MPEKVKIVSAYDNDTFKVQLKDGTTKSVRLISGNNQAWYDGFEKNQPGFKLDETVSSLVGKEVNINFKKQSEDEYKKNFTRELGSISTATIPDLAEHLYNKTQIYKRDSGKTWTLNKSEVQTDSLINPQQFKAVQNLLIKKDPSLQPKQVLAYKREIESAKNKFSFKTDKELVDFVKRRSTVPYESLKTFQLQVPITQSTMVNPVKNKSLKMSNKPVYKDSGKSYKTIGIDEANSLIENGEIVGTKVDQLRQELEQSGYVKDLAGYELHNANGTKYLFPIFKGDSQKNFKQALKSNQGEELSAFGNRYATSERAIKTWKDQFGISPTYTNSIQDSVTEVTPTQETAKKESNKLTYNAVGLPNRLDPNSSLSKLLEFDLRKNTEGTLGKWKASKFDTIQPNSVQSIGGKKAVVSESSTDKVLSKDGYDYRSYFFEDGTYKGPDRIGRWKFNDKGEPEIYATKRNDSNNNQFSEDFKGAVDSETNDVLFGSLGFLGRISPTGKYLAKVYDKVSGKIKAPISKITEKATGQAAKKGAGFKNIKVKPKLGTKTVYPPNYKPKIPKMDEDKLESWLNYEFKKGGILKFQNGQSLPTLNIPGINSPLSNNIPTVYGTRTGVALPQYNYSFVPKLSQSVNNFVNPYQQNKTDQMWMNSHGAGLKVDGDSGRMTGMARATNYMKPLGKPVQPYYDFKGSNMGTSTFTPNYTGIGSGDFSTMSDKPRVATNNRTGFGYQEANLALSVLPALLNTKVKSDKLSYQPYNPAIRGIQGDPLLQQRLTSVAQNKYLQNKAVSSDPTQELVRRLVVNNQAMQGNQEAYNVDTQARIADTQRYYSEKNAASQFNYTNKQNTDNQNIQMNNNTMMQNAVQKNQVMGQTIQNIMGYMTNKANDQNLLAQNYLVHKNQENQGALNMLAPKYASMYNALESSGLEETNPTEYARRSAEISQAYNQEYSEKQSGNSVNNLYAPNQKVLQRAGVWKYKKGGTISEETKVLEIVTRKATNLDKVFIDSARKYNELSSKVSIEALNRGSRLVVNALNNLPKTTIKSLPFKKLL